MGARGEFIPCPHALKVDNQSYGSMYKKAPLSSTESRNYAEEKNLFVYFFFSAVCSHSFLIELSSSKRLGC